MGAVDEDLEHEYSSFMSSYVAGSDVSVAKFLDHFHATIPPIATHGSPGI